uniref:Ig-like domain-containing protein n=1 Tax=Neolamprologus brichardi TaxID=32507 RepID=A0A3Q4HH85_NEOBR
HVTTERQLTDWRAGVLPDDRLNAAVGETVMFNTTVTPTEKPFQSVNWSFNFSKPIIVINSQETIGPEYEGRITFFPSTASLELRSLTLDDTGPYTSLQYVEHVKIPVMIKKVSNVLVTSSSTDLVEFSGSVSLSCSASGSSLSFLWLNGSSEVTASDRVQLTDGGSSLTIINVTRFDQGPFRCRVSNPVSTVTSDPVNLFISYGPENINLILPPPQGYFAVGSDTSLTCSVGSRPPAQFNWFLNGDQLLDTGSELRLMNVEMSQSGNYSCQAFNSKTLRSQTSEPSAITVLGKCNLLLMCVILCSLDSQPHVKQILLCFTCGCYDNNVGYDFITYCELYAISLTLSQFSKKSSVYF